MRRTCGVRRSELSRRFTERCIDSFGQEATWIALFKPFGAAARSLSLTQPDQRSNCQGFALFGELACGKSTEVGLGEFGRGGMEGVYLARDSKLGRRVAIKFLQISHPELVRRFVVEARATARCTHENIVVIHEVSEFQG